MRDQVDCTTLGLKTPVTTDRDDSGNHNDDNNNKLVAKLTQRFQLLAREQAPTTTNTRGSLSTSQRQEYHETPVQTETWDLDVATDGAVTIPSNVNIGNHDDVSSKKHRLLHVPHGSAHSCASRSYCVRTGCQAKVYTGNDPTDSGHPVIVMSCALMESCTYCGPNNIHQ